MSSLDELIRLRREVEAQRDAALRERDELRAENERLRAIADAAERWRDRTSLGDYVVHCDPGTPGEALQDLLAAVDAHRASLLGTASAVPAGRGAGAPRRAGRLVREV